MHCLMPFIVVSHCGLLSFFCNALYSEAISNINGTLIECPQWLCQAIKPPSELRLRKVSHNTKLRRMISCTGVLMQSSCVDLKSFSCPENPNFDTIDSLIHSNTIGWHWLSFTIRTHHGLVWLVFNPPGAVRSWTRQRRIYMHSLLFMWYFNRCERGCCLCLSFDAQKIDLSTNLKARETSVEARVVSANLCHRASIAEFSNDSWGSFVQAYFLRSLATNHILYFCIKYVRPVVGRSGESYGTWHILQNTACGHVIRRTTCGTSTTERALWNDLHPKWHII